MSSINKISIGIYNCSTGKALYCFNSAEDFLRYFTIYNEKLDLYNFLELIKNSSSGLGFRVIIGDNIYEESIYKDVTPDPVDIDSLIEALQRDNNSLRESLRQINSENVELSQRNERQKRALQTLMNSESL